MSIQLLPGDVIAQLKSSAVITSLNGVICGLLQNSLDAGAHKISISVDYSRGNCSVEDNGLGIAPASFQEGGGLGKLHYTSKYPPRPDCHGKRGEFLASLASLSLLSIASHHRDYRTHNSMTIHNSRVVARNLPALPEQRVLTSASGTRVTVRDLFGSMPVRVKQRAIEVERGGTTRDFEQLIFNIVALLLPWPGEVALSVQNLYTHRTVSLQTPEIAGLSTGQLRTEPTTLTRTRMLLAQASMVDSEDLKSWVPIGATASGITVRGCVSLQPVASKHIQFIALEIQPLLNEHHSNLFYEDVNRAFEGSSFGVIEEIGLDDDGRPTKTHGFTGKELKPKKGIDRWPMFFLQITLGSGTDSGDIERFLDESHQTVAVITDLLQVMAYEFLKKHHFRPKSIAAVERLKREKAKFSASPKPLSGPSLGHGGPQTNPEVRRSQKHSSSRGSTPRISKDRPASPFAAWSRTKLSLPRHSSAKKTVNPNPEAQQTTERPTADRHPPSTRMADPLFDKSGFLLRKPYDDEDETETSFVADTTENQLFDTSIGRETVVWVDPKTKIKSLIDASTGFAVKSRSNIKRGLIMPHLKRQRSRDIPQKLTWKPPAAGERNGMYQATGPQIPRSFQASETLCCGHGGRDREFQGLGDIVADPADGSPRTTLEGRISKSALLGVEVVAQVDKKFILVKAAAALPSTSSIHAAKHDHMLILIDQHAADERCRVEDLLKAYFISDPTGTDQLIPQTQSLDKPLRFDLSKQDGELLVRFRTHFAHWGISYEVFYSSEMPSQHGVAVEVQALPISILERCRLEPRLLIDLLRKEVWKLHGHGSLGTRSALRASKDDDDWVARFYHCPEGVVELIHSRACRSAIMFNDPLTLEQCAELVQRLAACAFPFQCAHGRPSMVPLVHVGEGSTLGIRVGEPGHDGDLWGALRTWKRKARHED